MNRSAVVARLRQLRLVPVITIDDPKSAPALGRALIEGGLPCAEITFRTAGAREALKQLTGECPELLAAAGTVLTPAQVDEAVEAGAKFIVAPGFNPKVVEHCLERDIPVFPGVATPTEIEAALALGLDVLKVFPIEPLGGLSYLKAISAPYPALEFMPTGGITLDNVGAYLAWPKIVACGGSWIAPTEYIREGLFDRITDEASKAVAAANSIARMPGTRNTGPSF
jgi:2-dehydro-3-deoxyphosphogluconate aldolase/(4S)-4-hydroxy-2-oxoglutarate aldolase